MYWRGLLIGLSIAAPVGPIGVLCIRRTLDEGRLTGLVSGLGAATADAMYGLVAGLGLTVISNFLLGQERWLRLIGGLFLLYLGIRTVVKLPAGTEIVASGQGVLAAYLSTFVLTLTNPITILSFAAVFAGLGLAETDGGIGAVVLLVAGVFTGSTLWWWFLSGGVSLARSWFSPPRMVWVNRAAGVVIAVFGLVAIGGLFT